MEKTRPILYDKLSAESLRAVYPGAHDLDLNTAVEKLGRQFFAKEMAK